MSVFATDIDSETLIEEIKSRIIELRMEKNLVRKTSGICKTVCKKHLNTEMNRINRDIRFFNSKLTELY